MTPPRVPATRPPSTPTRIAASKPRSAHWKFLTRKRKYTPSAKGMQVKRTKRILRSRERRLAKSSFLNSWERPSALATAVATPNLSRSCISRYSRSTELLCHRSGAVRARGLRAADLLQFTREAGRRERSDRERRRAAFDQVGHDFSGDRRQKDAVAKMAAGNQDTRRLRGAENGQAVGRAR